MKITTKDFQQGLEQRFAKYLQQMNHEEMVMAEKGKERLRFKIYRTKGDKGFPLKKVTLMILDYGLVWNKDDKKLLDEDELIVASFITLDDIPLPVLAAEASLHWNKYDHLNIDLFPLSKDPRYRQIFCEPVKALRKKNDGLPGLLPGVRTPSLLDEYTSGGMMAGDFEIALRDKSVPWWFEYVDLYKGLLDTIANYPILKEPAIIEEGKKVRNLFLTSFQKASPRILSDIPNLYSEERGKQLGELLF
ncbi:MAG: hypothetical protein NT096_02310 [Proteobacteria bacterium]|nr:hypothetical protein [Pseudomonadota bacterium]